MKKTKLLLLFACGIILFSCNLNTGQKSIDDIKTEYFRQDSIKEALATEYFRHDSIDALQIKGYSVKKISGKHNGYGEKTEIEYQSLPQILAETKKESEKEMWTKEHFQSEIKMEKFIYVGGQIILHIERTTIGSANTEFFTIIIKDSDENEILRKTLKSDIPDPSYSNDTWRNFALCSVDKRIKTPFFVYVVDAIEEEAFKFEVNAIKK